MFRNIVKMVNRIRLIFQQYIKGFKVELRNNRVELNRSKTTVLELAGPEIR